MYTLTLAYTNKHTHTHQVIHVGFAGRMDVFQELQQVEGVTVHQVDSYGQIRLVLERDRVQQKCQKKNSLVFTQRWCT